MAMKNTLTDERLDEAYKIMAGLVRNYGDKFLPVFQLLHEERANRIARQNLKNIALQVADHMAD